MTAQIIPMPTMRPIPIEAAPCHIELRGETVRLLLDLVADYVCRQVTEAADNAPPGSIDKAALHRTIRNNLSDLSGDVCGTIQQAADQMRGR